MDRSRSARRLAAALALLAAGCTPPPKPAEEPPGPRPHTTGIASPPLEVGAELPPLTVEGWVNGAPPAPGAPGVKLTVVDVWALWCPFCARSAPALARAHEKYAGQGVAFVSVTSDEREVVENFARRYKLAWPNGYGASAALLAALGAGSGMPGPAEYEGAPTVYLVGPDGRVRWADGRGRMKHQDEKAWGKALDDAIAEALAAPPKP